MSVVLCPRHVDLVNGETVLDVQSNWWEHFFEGAPVALWLQALSPEHTAREADSLVRALDVSPRAELLDVPCGSGRLSLELASRGHRMIGVDWSHEFLAHARSSDAARDVTWERRDMRDLPWPARFDGAFCLGNSFGTHISNGQVDTRYGSHRAYTYRQLVELLERAGFTVQTAEPWTKQAHNVSFIATRV
jgi:SAM-dependent methyltransferase